MIDITGVDLVKFAKKVYGLSVPRGFGSLHYTLGDLSDDEAIGLVRVNGPIALDMDYFRGRGCKMTVRRQNGKLTIPDNWPDHTDDELKELLGEFGINFKITVGHNPGCECKDCMSKR